MLACIVFNAQLLLKSPTLDLAASTPQNADGGRAS